MEYPQTSESKHRRTNALIALAIGTFSGACFTGWVVTMLPELAQDAEWADLIRRFLLWPNSKALGFVLMLLATWWGPTLLVFYRRERIRKHRNRRGHCRECGYDLRGLVDSRCPECGADFELRETSV